MRVLTAEDIDDVFSFRICVESFGAEVVPRMKKRDLVLVGHRTRCSRRRRIAM